MKVVYSIVRSTFCRAFTFMVLAFLAGSIHAQFNTGTITLDGTASEGAYITSGAYSMAWDDTYLYVRYSGGASNEPAILYFDVNPINPVDGGTNANGSIVGASHYSITPTLPFRADFNVYWESNNAGYLTANGSGGWNSFVSIGTGDRSNTGTADREIRLSWVGMMGLAGRPAAFNWVAYANSTTSFVFNETPSENPEGFGATPTLNYYYTVSSTANDANITDPFSRKSFESRSTLTLGTTNTFWDFTTNGGTLTNTVNVTVNNQLYVVSGTLTQTGARTITFGSLSTHTPSLRCDGIINPNNGGGNDLICTFANGATTIFGTATDANFRLFDVNVSTGATLQAPTTGIVTLGLQFGTMTANGTGIVNFRNASGVVNVNVVNNSTNNYNFSNTAGAATFNTLTVSTGATFRPITTGTHSLNIGGNLANTPGAYATTNSAGILNTTFNGPGAQSVSAAQVFQNLTIANGGSLVSNAIGVTFGGSITIAASRVLTVNSGSRFDTGQNALTLTSATGTVSGFWRTGGASVTLPVFLGVGSNVTFSSSGIYEHNYSGTITGFVPLFTWQSGSTCRIIGYVTLSVGWTTANGWAQSFQNFEWACSNQTGTINVQLNTLPTFTVLGNLTVSNTGTAANGWRLASSASYTVNVGGNFAVNASASFARMDLCSGGAGTINVSGNLTVNNVGTNLLSVTGGSATVNFAGSALQTVTVPTPGNITGAVSFRINNASGLSIPTGNTLPINNGATFFRTNGAVTLAGTGVIAYNATGSTLGYDGTSAMTTTDAEWPTTLGPVNVVFNTSPGTVQITLHASRSLPAAGVLTLTLGRLLLGNNNLTLNNPLTGASMPATIPTANNMVVTDGTGLFIRAIPASALGAYNWPVGDITGTPEASRVQLGFVFGNSALRLIGVRVVDASHPNIDSPTVVADKLSRYWVFSENGVGGTWSFSMGLEYPVADVIGTESNLRVSRSTGSDWVDYPTTTGAGVLTSTGFFNQTDFTINSAEFSGRRSPTKTYAWVATSGSADWQTAASWSPARSAPAFDDILTFPNGGTSTATNVPAQLVGQMVMSNSTIVTLVPTAANNALTLMGGAGVDLDVPSGCAMTVGQASGNSLSLTFGVAGNTTSIVGTYTIPVNTTNVHNFNTTNSTTTVTGTFNMGGSVTGATIATLTFGAGSFYNHTRDAGAIPISTWNATSTLTLSGQTSVTAPTSLAQNIGNFVMNMPALAATLAMTGTNNPSAIAGSWIISSTNNSIVDLSTINRVYTCNLTVTGNSRIYLLRGTATAAALTVNNFDLTTNAGSTQGWTMNNSTATSSSTFTVSGNCTINSASTAYAFSWVNATGNTGIFRVAGDFTHTAGSLLGGIIATNRLRFINAGTKNFSSASNVALTSVEVDGGTLNIGATNFAFNAPVNVNTGGTFQLSGTGNVSVNTTNVAVLSGGAMVFSGSGLLANGGTFNLNSGGSLSTINVEGIASTPALTGSVQSAGIRTYNVGGNYTFNGTAAQSTGVGFTGAATLTINNSAGVSLTSAATVSTTVALNGGTLTLGANNLTVSNNATGAITGASATNFIVTDAAGQLLRTIAAAANTYNFPVGTATNYTPVSLNFAANSTSRNIGARVVNTMHPSNLPSTDYLSRFWALTNSTAIGTFTYTPTFTYVAPGDVTGIEANLKINRWNGSAWTEYNSSPNTTVASPTMTLTATLDQNTITNAGTNHFTGRVNPVPVSYTWVGGTAGVETDYNTAANWSPSGIPGSADNVTISSGTWACIVPAGSFSVADFTLNGTGNFQLAAGATYTIGGSLTIGGTPSTTFACTSALNISSTSAQTVPAWSYGSLNLSGGNRTLANSGTIGICGTYTPGAGVITITGSTVNYNGSGAQTITVANYNNLTISNNRLGATLTLPSGIIDVSGTFNPAVTNYVPSFTGNTIYFTGAAGQGVPAFTYNNLDIGFSNLARTWAASGTISIAGAFTTGSGVHTTTSSTVEWNGTAAQTIPALTTSTYNNVVIAGGSTKTLAAAMTFSGNLTVNSATFIQTAATTRNLIVSGNVVINGGIYQQSGTTNADLTVGGSFTMNGGAFFQHRGSAITAPNTVISGNFVQSAGTFDFCDAITAPSTPTGFVSLAGNFSSTGGFITTSGGTTATKGQWNFSGTVDRSYTKSLGLNDYVIFGRVGGLAGSLILNSNFSCEDCRFFVGANTTVTAGAFVFNIQNTDANITNENFTINSGGLLITANSGGLSGTVTLSGAPLPTWSINANARLEYTGNNVSTGLASIPVTQLGRLTWNGTGNLTLDNVLSISDQLNMSADGQIILGSNNLTVASAATLSGPFSVNRMIRADGSGFLIRSITGLGVGIPFTWPIGEATGTAEYSPVTINTIANSIAGNIGWQVTDAAHPQNGAATNYLSRYWTYTTNLSSYSWGSATFTYDPSDVNGSEASMLGNTWSAANNGWIDWASSSVAPNDLTITSGPASSQIASGDAFTGRDDDPIYYRTASTGPNTWSSASSWEVSTDPAFGSPAAAPATFAPNAVNSAGITVRAGHTINVGASTNADNLLVETTGIINLNTGTFTIANGIAATDCDLQGRINVNPGTTLINASGAGLVATGGYLFHDGSLSNFGTLTFNGTSTFQYDLNGGTLPTATWGVGSTCLITGLTTLVPGSLGQSFYNLTFNNVQTQAIGLANVITSIANDLTVMGTGGFELRMASTTAVTLSIGRDLVVSGGILTMNGTSPSFTVPSSNMIVGRDMTISGTGFFQNVNLFGSGANIPQVTVLRDLIVTSAGPGAGIPALSVTNALNGQATTPAAGRIDVGRHFSHNGAGIVRLSNSSTGAGTLNVTGNFTHTAGTIETTNSQPGNINFNGTSAQFFTASGNTVTGQVRYTVNTNAIVDMGISIALGNAFTTQTSSTLRMGSGGGIASSGASGNVQTTSRTFSPAGNYVYNGSINQATGSGLPSTLTGALTIANTGTSGNNTVTLITNNSTFSTINLNSGLFAIGTGQNINTASAGTINGNGGDFATGTTGGTIIVPSGAAFTGNSNPYNLTASSGVNFGAGTVTIQNGGTFQINGGGSVNTNAPFYADGSNLRYFINTDYGRFLEWSASSGRGYPWNVQLSNNTNLIPHAGGSYASVVMQTGGNLTIDANSNIYMDFASVNMVEDLRILGNLQLNGNLSGSQLPGSDFYVGGNWSDGSSAANFFPNGRSVFLNGAGVVQVGGTFSLSNNPFFALRLEKTSGEVVMSQDVYVSNILSFEAANNANLSRLTTERAIVTNAGIGAVARTGNGYVDAELRRAIGTGTNAWFYPVGRGGSYSPATLEMNGVSAGGDISVTAFDGDAAGLATSILDPNQSVNQHWIITNSGVTFTSYDAIFGFPTGDLDPLVVPASLLVGLNTGTWSYPVLGAITSNSVEATALTTFGTFALAECRDPDLFAVTGGGTICPGGPGVAVGLSGSQAGVFYQLQLDAVDTGSPVAGTGSAISFGVQINVGTYTVIATSTGGGCTLAMTGSVTITNFTTPAGVISGSSTVCNGLAATVTVTVTGTGPFSGTIDPGATPFSGAGPVFNINVTPSFNTSYIIASLSDANCAAQPGALTGTATITVLDRPTGVISGSATVCSGNNTTLSIAVTGTGPYSGTINPGAIPFSGSGPVITVIVAPLLNTTYTLASLSDANCAAQPGDLTGSAVITMATPFTWYQDADFDGYSNGNTLSSCTQPIGYYLLLNLVGVGDCNDSNADINPGADEWCNGLDDNCDGQIDEFLPGTTYFQDLDGDGFGNPSVSLVSCSQPIGYVTNNTDCNDGNAAVRPTATEVCNGIDDDCDGIVDEGCGPMNDFIETALILPASPASGCTFINGTLTGALVSPQSGAAVITGEDVWYYFTPTTAAVSIECATGSANVLLELRSFFGSVLDVENVVSVPGTERLNIGGLTPSETYFLRVRNFNSAQGTGAFTLCLRPLRAATCQLVPGQYSLCATFKSAYVGANQYNFTFDPAGPDPAVFGSTVGGATTILLSSVPGMNYNTTYAVSIEAVYNLTDGNGLSEVFTVPYVGAPCAMVTAPHLDPDLRSVDASPNVRFRNSIIGADRWVCGATEYEFEFTQQTPIVGLPFTAENNAPNRMINLFPISGIVPGATYLVRMRPVFGAVYGNWGPDYQTLIIAGPASLIVTDPEAEMFAMESGEDQPIDALIVYPNPTQGEELQLRTGGLNGPITVHVLDGLGRVVWSAQYTLSDTPQVTLEFERALTGGLYELVVMDGQKRRTARFVVQR